MNRWVRLIGSVVAMAMIANFQYAWALFVKPMMGATGWKLSDVQWGFTLFIAFETWVQPFAGRFMDRLGPRVFMSVGAVMCAVGWVGMGKTDSLMGLYALYSLAGIGAALVYLGSTIVGLKWFPDKLGLASGLSSFDRSHYSRRKLSLRVPVHRHRAGNHHLAGFAVHGESGPERSANRRKESGQQI
jgi:MFS transporter, OFA family, oxalate/formate antiporter